jgi:hypothetical protein
MPLYARHVDEHYPDRNPSEHADDFVVLSGSLEAGSFHRIANGPSEGRWSWGAGLGAATANFVASGYAKSPDECRIRIARSFRSMLTRADLRERPDARPGSPRREPAQAPDRPSGPLRSYDREKDRMLGPMLRNELLIAVRSGSLIVGMLSTHGAETWSWSLSGVGRPFEDFRWRGDAATERDAFDALAASWLLWTRWAGLEPVETLQRGARR